MIYLDNAATSFPKPEPCFRQGLADYLAMGASPGRGGYDAAMETQARVDAVRDQAASFFGAPGFVTCFAYNATEALNTLIQGLAKPGGHVVSTRLEHNSVLRPLHYLREAGICSWDLAPFNGQGVVEPEAVARVLRPETCLVVLNHASNVLGTVQPAEEIGPICVERGIPLILDVSQSAGSVPIHMRDWGVTGLAFTGHKSLLGPTGIGGLVIDPACEVRPTRFGGTGVDSASLKQSAEYPQRLEAGTVNVLGIFTLGRCLEYLRGSQAGQELDGERCLHERLMHGLKSIEGLEMDCPGHGPGRISLASFNLAGWKPHDVGAVLDGDYGIAVRTGLHCAPLLHQDLGNRDAGSVRASLGRHNTAGEVDTLLSALREMQTLKRSS